jgi:hypothetical protein
VSNNLSNLSPEQVSQAFLYLTKELPSLPPDLKHLSQLEWANLHYALSHVMWQKENSPLQ